MNFYAPPRPEAWGFLQFLRTVTVVALPLAAMAAGIGAAFEIVLIAVLVACATGAFWIARRVGPGGLQFCVIGVLAAIESALLLFALW